MEDGARMASTDLEESKSSEARRSDNTEPLTGVQFYITMASLTFASLLVFLDTSVVSTAIPKITDEFHSLPDVGWYGSAYQLGSSVCGPLSGRILHHFSLKWSYITFFMIFELGSVLCGAAQSSAMLIVGRAVAGIGAAGITSSALTALSATVTPKKRPAVLGILMGIAQLGTVCGPLIGGAFTTGVTWRWCFYVNLPCAAVIGVPILFFRIPDQRPKQPALSVLPHLYQYLDLLGFALLAVAVIQLLLALEYGGNQYAWNSSVVIGLFCGAGVTFIVWLFWNNWKGDDALLPFGILRRRVVWASGINYSFMMSTVFGTTFFLPIYFQAVLGATAVLSGVYFLALVIPQLLAAVVGGTLVPPFALVGGALGMVGSGLFTLLSPTTTTGQWIGFCIVAGVGRGISLQLPLVAVQNAVTPDEMAQAMAFSTFCQFIGPTVFITLYNTIFDTTLRKQVQMRLPSLNANEIVAVGATGFRSFVPAAYLPAILRSYSTAIDDTFYLQVGAGFLAWLAAFGMGWNKLRHQTATDEEESAERRESSKAPTEDEKENNGSSHERTIESE